MNTISATPLASTGPLVFVSTGLWPTNMCFRNTSIVIQNYLHTIVLFAPFLWTVFHLLLCRRSECWSAHQMAPMTACDVLLYMYVIFKTSHLKYIQTCENRIWECVNGHIKDKHEHSGCGHLLTNRCVSTELHSWRHCSHLYARVNYVRVQKYTINNASQCPKWSI